MNVMFEKYKIKRKIKKLSNSIREIEEKRYRSQAALVEAILTHNTPDDEDVDYFNKFTAEITNYRNEIHSLQLALKNK